MKRTTLAGIAASALLTITAAFPVVGNAYIINVNFDGVTGYADVDEYYDGGQDSQGANGPDYGITFSSISTLASISAPSLPNFAYNSSNSNYANVESGFTSLTFQYLAITPSVISVYDGANGTGNLLGSTDLSVNSTYDVLNFSPSAATFSGVGHSFVLTSTVDTGNAGYDNLVINAVPEPASIALLGIGTLAASALRRKKLTCEV